MTDYRAIKLIRNGDVYCFRDYFIDALVVGGGGGGGGSYGGGGGAGGVVHLCKAPTIDGCKELNITIGNGGNSCQNGGASAISGVNNSGAYGGGAGGNSTGCRGCNGGSGGGGRARATNCPYNAGGASWSNQGNAGGASILFKNYCMFNGGGGGGAERKGGDSGYSNYSYGECSMGGLGCTFNCGGIWFQYSYGGAGGGCISIPGTGGGGAGCDGDCNATTYGSGGGGSKSCSVSGKGYQGVVVIRWPADGSYGFKTATGGNCCTCVDGWCTRMFTSSGPFCIVS